MMLKSETWGAMQRRWGSIVADYTVEQTKQLIRNISGSRPSARNSRARDGEAGIIRLDLAQRRRAYAQHGRHFCLGGGRAAKTGAARAPSRSACDDRADRALFGLPLFALYIRKNPLGDPRRANGHKSLYLKLHHNRGARQYPFYRFSIQPPFNGVSLVDKSPICGLRALVGDVGCDLLSPKAGFRIAVAPN